MFGGLYIVPLYAIVQQRAEADYKARTIAANNVLNALFMVLGAAGAALLFAIGMTVTGIFLVIAAANVIAAYYVCKLLPTELMKGIAAGLLRLCYRVEVHGRSEEHTSELQSLMRISSAVFCLKKKTNNTENNTAEHI